MGLDNPVHIVLLLVILMLVFGARRLPELGRSLGSGMRGFKDSLQGTTPPLGIDQVVAVPAPVAVPTNSETAR
jgi:sec-independent protein translocase protein TatA